MDILWQGSFSDPKDELICTSKVPPHIPLSLLNFKCVQYIQAVSTMSSPLSLGILEKILHNLFFLDESKILYLIYFLF